MTSVITTLRDNVPIRPLTVPESLRIAELQATKFLALSGLVEPPFDEAAISKLPHVQVERIFPAPSSGASQWSRGRWLIVVNGSESQGRQRFTLGHEFKHVLDNPFIHVLYPGTSLTSAHDRAEQVCDYFAACLLMPRLWLKRAWAANQNVRSLAQHFEVSAAAMRVRLIQVGLAQPEGRHTSYMGAA